MVYKGTNWNLPQKPKGIKFCTCNNNTWNPLTEMKRKRNPIGETTLFRFNRHAIATILTS